MPFVPVATPKCPKCGASVYAAEQVLAAGAKFHKKCVKCNLCSKMLDSTTVTDHEGQLYCKQCHGRKFGPKGYGFGSGAGTLGTDKGERFGNKECEMDNKPSGAAPGYGGGDAGTGPKCNRCGKSVYGPEQAIGETLPWHKACYRCKDCGKNLDSTTVSKHEKEVYCKGCYGKNFGTSGYGFGQGAGTLSSAT